MSKSVNLIFPNQLYAQSPLHENKNEVYLIEEYLFFKQYQFHKQKIAFHRASMKYYQQYMEDMGIVVHYTDSKSDLSDIRNFGREIIEKGIKEICLIGLTDNWLEERIGQMANGCNLKIYEDPQFLNTKEELGSFFRTDKSSFFQTTFYKQQRRKRGILMDDNKPIGDKWTFDTENRKKYPKNKIPPIVHFPASSGYWQMAVDYTNTYFRDNPGELTNEKYYPITHKESGEWFHQFLEFRFYDFGIYEDAIVKDQIILNHSVLSPLLNVGLILPEEVVEKSLQFAAQNQIPINSTEGFIRQLIGWREFIRGMYICKGSSSRVQNFWNFNRKIPESFYTGTTGIEPVDDTIKKVLKTGYCHHIERLMILGNFMLLCEFHPNEVYRWFMELFIDAYDWVMAPNIYGMSQFADGGTFASKPYISGSNYIRKMSNYRRDDWDDVWDGLFWRFISNHMDFFSSNPRTSMLVHSYNKMSDEKKQQHFTNAELFIQEIMDNGNAER